jgi:hypothetical protein
MSVELLAWAKIDDQTEIQYLVSSSGVVEFSIGGRNGLTLDTTEQGLENLVRLGVAALRALRAEHGTAPAA